MAGFTDYTAQNELNYLTGSLAMPSLPSVWLALFTTAPTSDSGVTGAVEVSGGSYARVQIAGTLTTNGTTASGNNTLHFAATVPSWIVAGMLIRDQTTSSVIPANTTVVSTTSTTVVMSNNATGGGVGGTDVITFSAFMPASASSGSEPSTTPANSVNTNAIITFPPSTASWGTVLAWGLFDASTVGNNLWWDYLGNFKWLPFTGSSASPSVLTSPVHGYGNGDSVVVTTKFGGTLPTTAGSWSGPLTVANATTDTFTAGVNTSTTGDGEVRKITQQLIPINVTASFAAGAFTLTLA